MTDPQLKMRAIILIGPDAVIHGAGSRYPLVCEKDYRNIPAWALVCMIGSLRKNSHWSVDVRVGAALLLIVISQNALGQGVDSLAGTPPLSRRDSCLQSLRWYSMITNIPSDWSRFAVHTFKKDNLPGFVGMTVLTVGLMFADDETWTLSDRWYKGESSVEGVSDFFEYLGDGRPQFGLAAAFGAYGTIAGDKRRSIRGARSSRRSFRVVLSSRC